MPRSLTFFTWLPSTKVSAMLSVLSYLSTLGERQHRNPPRYGHGKSQRKMGSCAYSNTMSRIAQTICLDADSVNPIDVFSIVGIEQN